LFFADFGVSGQLSDTMAKRKTVIGTIFSFHLQTVAKICLLYVTDDKELPFGTLIFLAFALSH
jgi:hypothetical protein